MADNLMKLETVPILCPPWAYSIWHGP